MTGRQGYHKPGGRRRLGLGLGLGLFAALTMGCGPKYLQVPVLVRGRSGEAISSATLTPLPACYLGKNHDYPRQFPVDEKGFAIVDSLAKRGPIRVIVDFGGEEAVYVSDTLRIDMSRKYTPDRPFTFEADSVARVTTHKTETKGTREVGKDGKTIVIGSP